MGRSLKEKGWSYKRLPVQKVVEQRKTKKLIDFLIALQTLSINIQIESGCATCRMRPHHPPTNLVNQYTDRISTRLPEYRYNVGKYVEAYPKFAFWFASTDKSEEAQRQELYRALRDFKETSESLVGSMSEFIDNVQGLGRTALEDLGHTGLNNACMKLVGKLVGTLDTVRELNDHRQRRWI